MVWTSPPHTQLLLILRAAPQTVSLFQNAGVPVRQFLVPCGAPRSKGNKSIVSMSLPGHLQAPWKWPFLPVFWGHKDCIEKIHLRATNSPTFSVFEDTLYLQLIIKTAISQLHCMTTLSFTVFPGTPAVPQGCSHQRCCCSNALSACAPSGIRASTGCARPQEKYGKRGGTAQTFLQCGCRLTHPPPSAEAPRTARGRVFI